MAVTRTVSTFQADGGLTYGDPDNPTVVGAAATETDAGVVLQGVAVANATDTTDVITQLNALLASLRTSGAIASS